MITCRHWSRFRLGEFPLFPNLALPRACNNDNLFRFLNPSPIARMVASPALADDLVGRVDVTTSAYLFGAIIILREQTRLLSFRWKST